MFRLGTLLVHTCSTSSPFYKVPNLINNRSQVTTAPHGAQAATLDVEGAYRTIPMKPDHKRYIIVFFDGFFFMDHNVPFGLTSTSGLQGKVADATIDIWEHHNISPAVKWVDDFNTSASPSLIAFSSALVVVSSTHMVMISHLSRL